MLLAFGLVGCDGTKTIWFKGYLERAPEDRVRYFTSIDYETIEDGEKVWKEHRFTVWPNGKFLFGIKAQNYLHIEWVDIGFYSKVRKNIKLEGDDFKRQVIDLGTYYNYHPPDIKIPADYSGNLSDLNFEIVSYVPDVDHFDVFIDKLTITDGELPLWWYSRFIGITGLKNTNVSFGNFLDLTDGADTFMMDEAQVTIHDEFKPGVYGIHGSAFRIVEGKPVILTTFSSYPFEIVKDR